MVNQQPDGFDEQQWYPQLPEGYDMQQRQNIPSQGYGGTPSVMGGLQPGMVGIQGPSGWPPGMNLMPGQGPGHGSGGMQGWPPGYGAPGQGMPGYGQQPFRPPGHQNPMHQNPGQQGPTSAPPNYTPEYPENQLFRVDPGGIRGCLYRYTFIWLSRRQGFWFYPTFVGRTSVAGYRWRSSRRRWEYFGIDLDNIDSFTCF